MSLIGDAYTIIHILMICINIFLCIIFMIWYYISIQLYRLLN